MSGKEQESYSGSSDRGSGEKDDESSSSRQGKSWGSQETSNGKRSSEQESIESSKEDSTSNLKSDSDSDAIYDNDEDRVDDLDHNPIVPRASASFSTETEENSIGQEDQVHSMSDEEDVESVSQEADGDENSDDQEEAESIDVDKELLEFTQNEKVYKYTLNENTKIDIWDVGLKDLSEEQLEKLRHQDLRIKHKVEQEWLRLNNEEKKELQHGSIYIGDTVLIRSYDEYDHSCEYLRLEDREWIWAQDEAKAGLIEIQPVLKEPVYSVYQLETQRCEDYPNSEWSKKGGHSCYESEIQDVQYNLTYLHRKEKHPLGLNKTFVLKFPGINVKEHYFDKHGTYQKVYVRKWLLLRANESTEDVAVKPETSYYLSTIIDNKFYFLQKGWDHKLTRQREQAKTIQFYIVEK